MFRKYGPVWLAWNPENSRVVVERKKDQKIITGALSKVASAAWHDDAKKAAAVEERLVQTEGALKIRCEDAEFAAHAIVVTTKPGSGESSLSKHNRAMWLVGVLLAEAQPAGHNIAQSESFAADSVKQV